MDELLKMDSYPVWFIAKVIAWHENKSAIALHTEDVVRQKSRKGKRS